MGDAIICKHTFLGCFPWRYMEVWICLFDYNFFINLSVSEAKLLPKHFVILLASFAHSLSHLTHSHLPPCVTSAVFFFYPLLSSCLTSRPTPWLLGKACGCLSASAQTLLFHEAPLLVTTCSLSELCDNSTRESGQQHWLPLSTECGLRV